MKPLKRLFSNAVLILIVAVLTSAIGCRSPSAADRSGSSKLLPLKVVGTQILDSKNHPVRLRGVNAASMEYTSNGEGHILQTVNVAIQDWHVNVIRLPLSQDRWFGKAREQNDGGKAYRDLVQQVVDTCSTQHCYIILDLHWSDCNEWGQNIGQHSMPDLNSIAFWKDCAPIYANNPAVIFDLYNEPHDVTWDVWLKGGEILDKPNARNMTAKNYQCVGMQEMLDTIRATGAKNVVIAGGLDWAYDFSGILDGRQLSDPKGNGVIYANHCYDNKGDSVYAWIAKMEKATAKLPVIVAEFGGNSGPGKQVPADNWLLHVLQAIEDHQWSYIAWDLHPRAGPTLISDWNYTPSPRFGVFVKQMLTGTLPAYTPPSAPAENTAIIPVPNTYPSATNWISRHENYVAEARKGGVDLLFLGDSIIDGWRWGNGGVKLWPRYYESRHAANFGIGGDRTEHLLWRIQHGELDGITPRVTVLLIGTNNKGRNTAGEIAAGMTAIVKELRAKLPEGKVLLLGIFPRGEKDDPFGQTIKDINLQLARLDDGKMVRFLDIGPKLLGPDGTLSRDVMPDLLHVNEKGYQMWAEAMEDTLAEMLR